MVADETPLQVAQRHARQQEELIAKQRTMIERLAAVGVPTQVARDTLRTMERILALLRSNVARRSGRKILPGRQASPRLDQRETDPRRKCHQDRRYAECQPEGTLVTARDNKNCQQE